MIRRNLLLLLAAGLATGVSDGLFSSVLNVVFYHSTVTRLWQGVASTLLGKSAFDGGARTAGIGLLMHFGVALGWTAVLLTAVNLSPWLRRAVVSSYGSLKVATFYGPAIWLFMSFIVIPLLVHRPPNVGIRWWVQLIGHIPFVALPMASVIARGLRNAVR